MSKNNLKILFYDLETTGVKINKHSIHQIGLIMTIDSEEVDRLNIHVAPNPKAEIDPEALKTTNVTEEQIKAYQPMGEGYKQLISFISKHIDRYDRQDKAFLCGYNNAKFDDIFLRAWFEQNGDMYFGSYFWSGAMDSMVYATQRLRNVRKRMPDFKLKTVARQLGVEVDESKLHDAMYDIELTREIYYICTEEL